MGFPTKSLSFSAKFFKFLRKLVKDFLFLGVFSISLEFFSIFLEFSSIFLEFLPNFCLSFFSGKRKRKPVLEWLVALTISTYIVPMILFILVPFQVSLNFCLCTVLFFAARHFTSFSLLTPSSFDQKRMCLDPSKVHKKTQLRRT